MGRAEGRQLNGQLGQLEKWKSKTQSDLSDRVVLDWKMKVEADPGHHEPDHRGQHLHQQN